MKNREYSNLCEIIRLSGSQTEEGKLPLEEMEKWMNDQIKMRVIPADTKIFQSGEDPDKVYFVVHGSYFNYRISPDGKMHVLGREHAPQRLGIDRAVGQVRVNLAENRTLEE